MLSGLKHFAFCKRRWALVHIEQLWQENTLTLDGHYMHERVHDAGFTESRGSTCPEPCPSDHSIFVSPANVTWWNCTETRTVSRFTVEMDCGHCILWNISVESRMNAEPTSFNSVHRPFVWKKCS